MRSFSLPLKTTVAAPTRFRRAKGWALGGPLLCVVRHSLSRGYRATGHHNRHENFLLEGRRESFDPNRGKGLGPGQLTLSTNKLMRQLLSSPFLVQTHIDCPQRSPRQAKYDENYMFQWDFRYLRFLSLTFSSSFFFRWRSVATQAPYENRFPFIREFWLPDKVKVSSYQRTFYVALRRVIEKERKSRKVR